MIWLYDVNIGCDLVLNIRHCGLVVRGCSGDNKCHGIEARKERLLKGRNWWQ